MIGVAVQHQQRLLREGIAHLIATAGGVRVVGTVAIARDLVAMCHEKEPQAVIIQAGDTPWDLFALVERLMMGFAGLHVVAVHQGEPTNNEAAEARRVGFSLFSSHRGIGSVCFAVTEHGRFAECSQAIGPRQATQLSSRQLSVLTLVAGGWNSQSISVRLGISTKTVENHKQRIFELLGVQTQAHAVSIAIRKGLVDAGQAMESGIDRVDREPAPVASTSIAGA